MKHGLSKLLSTRAENAATIPKVEFSIYNKHSNFPLVITPNSSGLILAEWALQNRSLFEEKLNIHGAILLRGFEIDTVEKFQKFIEAFDATPLEYKQRSSPRYEVAKNIYDSTTYPNDQSINMHSENSYAPNWSMRILFCCIQPAQEQGETPIADNRAVVKALTEATKEKFLQKGVRYIRNISPGIGLPWKEIFQTSDKNIVEKECKEKGMSFTWKDNNDRLVLEWNNQAIYDHPYTGERVWFNHAFFFNKYALNEDVLATFQSDDELAFHTCFGDGTEISKAEIEEIRTAYERSTIVFPWQKGDVLFLDNMLMAHGRKPYKGNRKIIVSMF